MSILLGALYAALSLWVLTALVLAGYDLVSWLHYRWGERTSRPVSRPRDIFAGRHRR